MPEKDIYDLEQRAFCVFTFWLILIRLYVRIFVPSSVYRRWWAYLGEAFIIIAWAAFASEMVFYATGVWSRVEDFEILLKWFYWHWIQYLITWYGTKAALLIFYHEWIPESRPMRSYRWANIALMVLTAACFLVSVGVNAFWCWPISRNWADVGDICSASILGATSLVFWLRWSLHVVTDLFIFILPISVLYRTESLTTRQKLGASVMFLLGAGDIIFSTVVMGLFVQNSGSGADNRISLFSNISQTFGIVATCCPALRVFVVRSWKYWRSKFSSCRSKHHLPIPDTPQDQRGDFKGSADSLGTLEDGVSAHEMKVEVQSGTRNAATTVSLVPPAHIQPKSRQSIPERIVAMGSFKFSFASLSR